MSFLLFEPEFIREAIALGQQHDLGNWYYIPCWMFNRPEPRVTFGLMVRALLADVPKKNSWGLAVHAGLSTPRPFEHLLDGAVWDADVLRDHVCDYVVAGLESAEVM
jgi:hypothetical protein